MEKIRIGIIVDWKRCSRKNAWLAILKKFDESGKFPNETEEYPIADLIVKDPPYRGQSSRHFIEDHKVLIINWDVANGDPEFGSYLTLRWLEHRCPELILWVMQGNILIIEGQAVLGVPCQKAYNALTGSDDLPVSGPEQYEDPWKQVERMGNQCQKTKNAPTSGGFEFVRNPIRVENSPAFSTYFEGPAATRIISIAEHFPWSTMLYRGWFRRFLPVGQRFHWVSIVKTAGRGRWKNHSTMQVAHVAKGAIFASTMFLSTTSQEALILAMLNCAKIGTKHLPNPPAYIETMQKWWNNLLPVLAGILAGYLASDFFPGRESVDNLIKEEFSIWSQENVKRYITAALMIIGASVFVKGWPLLMKLRRQVNDFIGF